MAELLSIVLSRLTRWEPLGRRTSKSGATQIGRVPHVAPEAWLHSIFAPITAEEQLSILDRCPTYSGSGLHEVHGEFNGVNLFSGNFFLYGRRSNYFRSPDNVLPWDLINANQEVRGRLAPGALLVGGSNALSSGIDFVESPNRTITAVENRDWNKVLFEWPNLRDCILSELTRLSVLFDSQGRAIDKASLASFGHNSGLQ
jgi:hypothetical protein